jgi:hypothetical protein
MKQWKCEQCEYSSRFKRQIDINTPLPDGIFCTVYKKIIKDDDKECKNYCVASYLM